jgi:hypothetical protein
MMPAIAVLLRLYPRDFREAYGPLIELQVRDELRSARGPFTAVRIITDVMRGAAAERVTACGRAIDRAASEGSTSSRCGHGATTR